MALVEVDIARLVRWFGTEDRALSVHLVDTFSSATMYVHPEGGIARFLLMGLRPETRYTLVVKYGVETQRYLGTAGRKAFRTKHAQLAGVETPGLDHTEATVRVSLGGADIDTKRVFKFYPHSNKDEAGTDYTFYLRHRASDETEWAAPVELTFSNFVADARLTGLDPGTAYDVEVAETADFMPPTTAAGSYTKTLTVGDEGSGSEIWGLDVTGYFGDPYGSMSPDRTLELKGLYTHEITVLYAHPFGGPDFDQPALYLEFDSGLAGTDIEFTLTVDGTEYHSVDSSQEGFGGVSGWEWLGGPTWSEDDTVTVQIDFQSVPEAFREGSRLEEVGAFTTHSMPPTLAFEAEMTVGVTTTFDGYYAIVDPPAGSISSNTFEVGGVEYTVNDVSFEKGANPRFALDVAPALPYESFTLTLGSTELLSSSATVEVNNDGSGTYHWSGTNPNWTQGQTVDVKLDIGLIDICDRSSAVAYAIVKATPSYDFCHMTSQLDLAGITELDLPGGRGTGLKAGDFEGLSRLTRLDLSYYRLGDHRWNQLPVGVFDGLDSLTHLDISHTGLQNLNLGVFEGLDNLEVLDLTDTLLQRGTVPVGVFDGLDNLEVLRLTNESSIGGYRTTFSNLDDDIFEGLVNLRELDVGASTPLRDSPLSLLPLTSLTTYNGQSYTRPADPPALEYASGRIDHERGYSKTCYTVTLKWDAPTGVSGITGYRILRNLGAESLSRYAKQIATTGASARSFVDGRDADVCFGGVGSGPNVSYFVSAITAGGDSFPARVRVDQTRSFPTTQVPPTPTLSASLYDLSVAKSPNGYKVRLQWNDLHHNITGYEISFRGSSTADWRTIVVNAGNVLEYDLESIPVPPTADGPRTPEFLALYNAFRDQGESIGYTDGREFRIRAINAAGKSGWSNVVRPFR